MRYAAVYIPENKICEAYNDGRQYDLYTSRAACERMIRENLASWAANYRAVPVPTYPGLDPDKDCVCDPAYTCPSLFEHPDLDAEHYNETGEVRLISYGERIELLPEQDA